MPKRPQHLDDLFADWPYEFGEVVARLTKGGDGREVLQLRIDLGVLQLETSDRPDGTRPGGYPTVLDHLHALLSEQGDDFELDDAQCLAVDREFVQFYHRRIAWLSLGEFDRAMADADHTLQLMDFSSLHAPHIEWAEMHEEYRPVRIIPSHASGGARGSRSTFARQSGARDRTRHRTDSQHVPLARR